MPSRPAMVHMVQTGDFKNRIKMEWIGKGIPVEDAKWIGSILAKLTPEQIHDAFGGAGYSPREVGGVLASFGKSELRELNKL